MRLVRWFGFLRTPTRCSINDLSWPSTSICGELAHTASTGSLTKSLPISGAASRFRSYCIATLSIVVSALRSDDTAGRHSQAHRDGVIPLVCPLLSQTLFHLGLFAYFLALRESSSLLWSQNESRGRESTLEGAHVVTCPR